MSEFPPVPESNFSLEQQLDQQIVRYADLVYGSMLRQTRQEFINGFTGLKEVVSKLDTPEGSDLPLLAVIPSSLISLKDQLALTGNRAYIKETEMQQMPRD